METIPQSCATYTPPIEAEPGTLFTPEQQAERAAQWDKLLAEAEPAVNLHGERLDNLPPLTLADELAEVDAAVADGICPPSWAVQACRLIRERHGVEPPPPPDGEAEPSPAEHAPVERATETAGCDPPAIDGTASKLADLLADDELIDAATRRQGEAVVATSFERLRSEAPPELDDDDLGGVAGDVLDKPDRRRDRHHRRLSRLVAEVTGRDDPSKGDTDGGYLLLCADAGEALAEAVERMARMCSAELAEAVEAQRQRQARAQRATRRKHRPQPVEVEPMELVRPHVEAGGPTNAQRDDLALALALAAVAGPDEAKAAVALVRQAALAADDHETAAWAKARLRELRRVEA